MKSPRKIHGGSRPGAGRKVACQADRLAALYHAEAFAVTVTYARSMLTLNGPELLPASIWRGIAICIEAEISEAEALQQLKTL